MKHVYIIHGYQAVPEDHWFPWLEQHILQTGAIAERVFLADSAHPDADVWQECLSAQCTVLNENTIIVAHSLGCVSSLNFLSKVLQKSSIGAGIFVSGFTEKLNAIPELDQFMESQTLDDKLLRQHILRRYVLLSSNDPFVSPPLTIRLGQRLNAQILEIKQAGHFMQEDGYTAFPQLWDVLRPLLTDS
ncbi:serine hydrolase family protein [Acinetobacter sp. S40]|uniref:RBBP9/YdeN family alpha/beta hydrolase n=1 Tax=Acinetobacter sp. S40 TaxID=2767434 RepID=UPI00190E2B22|nr:alpha/beta hydrolase [Acinetobacter sp. S40]MBJ9986615.1 serine hydrolase family protein [Acinetobacter sp. S40]